MLSARQAAGRWEERGSPESPPQVPGTSWATGSRAEKEGRWWQKKGPGTASRLPHRSTWVVCKGSLKYTVERNRHTASITCSTAEKIRGDVIRLSQLHRGHCCPAAQRPLSHRITEYPELEGTYTKHRVQALELQPPEDRTTQSDWQAFPRGKMLLVDEVKEEQEKKIPRSKKQDSVQIKKNCRTRDRNHKLSICSPSAGDWEAVSSWGTAYAWRAPRGTRYVRKLILRAFLNRRSANSSYLHPALEWAH